MKAAAGEDIFLDGALLSNFCCCGMAGQKEVARREGGVGRLLDGLAGVESWGLSLGVDCLQSWCDSRVSGGANPGEVRSNRGPIKGALGGGQP